MQRSLMRKSWSPSAVGVAAGVLALISLAAIVYGNMPAIVSSAAARDVDEKLTAFRFLKDNDNDPNPFNTESGVLVHVSSEHQAKKSEGIAPEVVVYASDLSERALYEFDFANDPSSPGGKMVITPNKGDELDPPPENDPHVIFRAKVQRGVPYRCWIHMKVGTPKGKSQANMVWVQFTDAVDKSSKEVLAPGTGSYLTARGPQRQGWVWVPCDAANSKSSESLVSFRKSGEVTVRVQAGMEGVGFDQLVLSPARYLEKPPSDAIEKK